MSLDPATEAAAGPWLTRVLAQSRGPIARAVVIAIRGSSRRHLGGSLMLDEAGASGSIGEATGASAIAAARRLLGNEGRWVRDLLAVPQGPILGQAPTGTIDVLVEVFGDRERRELRDMLAASANSRGGSLDLMLVRPLRGPCAAAIIDGRQAGALPEQAQAAVGRLIALPSDTVAVTDFGPGPLGWVAERLAPVRLPFHVHGATDVATALVRVLHGTPFAAVMHQPGSLLPAECLGDPRAFHAVLSGDHETDVALCRSILEAGPFGYLGLIGSRLKRAGLVARLADVGIAPEVTDRISCPIGLPAVAGKEPAVIAISIAAEAISVLRRRRD